MHDIPKAGVKTCCSTFCQNNKKLRICHLEVTKELASILISLNCHLEGPICTLFFQVKSALPDGIVAMVNSDEKVATPAPLNLPPQKKVVLPNEEVNVDISVDLNLLNSSSSPPGSPQASKTDSLQEMVHNMVVVPPDVGSNKDSDYEVPISGGDRVDSP